MEGTIGLISGEVDNIIYCDFSGHSLQTYRKQNYRREKCEIGETQLVGGINKIEIFSKSWKWKQKYKK
jgi:hypothetical protein